ncbi:MAG TPA: type II toxin-antitoxin system HipA family toxin YjjJ [Myxococcota bacterium]|nr:type II toxin-antitoxin system HipA family toxin YjjJ [Myxococcota bacterium]
MPTNTNRQALIQALRGFLGRSGPSSGRRGREALEISQPVFSRLVSSAPDEILVAGRGRSTRYAARRLILGLDLRIPVYAIGAGRSENRQIAVLHPVEPGGFYLESGSDDIEAGFFDDLPYFLYDLRPEGFLGRLVPRRHPELELPEDIRYWSADHCLRYLVRYGWDPPGNLVCGEEAFRLYLAAVQAPPNLVARDDRKRAYPRLAEDVLAAGPPGSSTAGEHPKFLATRAHGNQPVMVKFSPPIGTEAGRRIADLLICEKLALDLLAEHGHSAARSELVLAEERVFLELERFDRLSVRGRRGTLSLTALDARFVGKLGKWTNTLESLVRQGRAKDGDLKEARFREVFGRLIANSDMHPGNLSFFIHGERTAGLTPAYDMLPAAYAPRHGQNPVPEFAPLPPAPSEAAVWKQAGDAALALWKNTAGHPLVSEEFKKIASDNAAILTSLDHMADLLPLE